MSEPLTGQCACGAIHYQIHTRIRQAVNCHCNMCRTHNGTAFSSYGVVPESRFELQDAENLLSGYGFSDRVRKHFCSRCGTPLYNTNSRYEKYLMIFLGTLKESREVVPNANIYCSSQLDWVKAIDAIDDYPEAFGE